MLITKQHNLDIKLYMNDVRTDIILTKSNQVNNPKYINSLTYIVNCTDVSVYQPFDTKQNCMFTMSEQLSTCERPLQYEIHKYIIICI